MYPLHSRRTEAEDRSLEALGTLGSVDAAAAALLGVALLRGLWIGLVREAFSLAALAAACLAVRFGTGAAAPALAGISPWPLAPLAAQILAGAALALGAVLVVALVGRAVRGGVRAAGLGALDRLGGGALGAAEGALLLAVLLLGALALLGPGHPWLADSRAVSIVLAARERASALPGDVVGDVAAPPPPERGGP